MSESAAFAESKGLIIEEGGGDNDAVIIVGRIVALFLRCRLRFVRSVERFAKRARLRNCGVARAMSSCVCQEGKG